MSTLMTPLLDVLTAIGALCVTCMMAFCLVALFSVVASTRHERARGRHSLHSVGEVAPRMVEREDRRRSPNRPRHLPLADR
ncbi:MAG: hypothetical protein ACLQRH_19365 [Acidimicrobiales bacterium]